MPSTEGGRGQRRHMSESLLNSADLQYSSPEALERLLERSGWRPVRTDDRSSIWSTAGARIMIPRKRGMADFSQRLYDALSVIHEVQPQIWDRVLLSLFSARADVLKFRSLVDTPADGSVRLDIGLRFLQAVQEIVVAAAKASSELKLPQYAQRNRHLAEEYLETARLGQTEKGSFVVTVLSRLPEVEAPEDLGEQRLFEAAAEPPQRRTNLMVVESVAAAQSASEYFAQTRDFSIFREAVESGVSAELCQAAKGLLALDADVEVSLSLATDVAASRTGPTVVRLSRDSFDALDHAVREFRSSDPVPGVRVVGVVEDLHRSTLSDGAGTVALRVLDNSSNLEMNKLRLRLEPHEYDEAIEAHRQNRVIRVVGSIEREANLFWLYSPREFAVGSYYTDSDLVEIEGQVELDFGL